MSDTGLAQVWTQSPTPTKTLFAVGACWKRELQFPEWNDFGSSNHIQGQAQSPGVVWPTRGLFFFFKCVFLVLI